MPHRKTNVTTLRTDPETAGDLQRYVEKTGIKAAAVSRAALRFALSRLMSGEMAIINGELAPLPRQ